MESRALEPSVHWVWVIALAFALVAATAVAQGQTTSCDVPDPGTQLVKPPQSVDAYGVFCFEQCKLGHFRMDTTEGFCGIGQNCPLAGDNGPVGVAIPNRPCRIPFIAGWHLRIRGHPKSDCGIPEDPTCSKCVIGYDDRTPSEVNPSLEYFVYSNRFEDTARENALVLHPPSVAFPDTELADVWADFPIVPNLDGDSHPSCAVTTDRCPEVCPLNSRGQRLPHCLDEDDMRLFCDHKPHLDLPGPPKGDRNFTNVTATLSPGRYGIVKIGKSAKIALEAGDYEFAELRIDKAGTLVAVGAVNAQVKGRTSLAGHFYALPADFVGDRFSDPPAVAHDPAAPPARILVDPVGSLDDVTLGTDREYDIDLCYPRDGGIVAPGERNMIRGRLVAWKVIGGEDNDFRCYN